MTPASRPPSTPPPGSEPRGVRPSEGRPSTEGIALEGWFRAEQRVLESLGRADPSNETLRVLVEAMETLVHEARASVVFIEDGRIRPGPAPGLDPAYLRLLDGVAIGPSAGSCGTAAWRGEAVFVEDIRTSPLWEDYRALGERFGFRFCWSVPIRASDGRVLGTFALYGVEPALPDPLTVEILERAGYLAALALERALTAEALRRSNEHLALIHERVPVGIVLSRVEDGQVLEANPAWLRMLGYRREEVVGRSSLEVGIWIDPEERASVARELEERGRVGPREIRVRRRDGVVRWLEIHVDLVEVGGAPCAVSMQRDVTEEREQELRLRRAERLATIGTLVGGVAHELNNPLGAIVGFGEFLEGLPLPPEAGEPVAVIRREADRMARIVSDLRLLARRSQETRPEPEAVDLADVIEHVLRLRRYTHESHGIEASVVLDPEGGTVRGFRTDLEQVLLNLLTNAEHALDVRPAGERFLRLDTRRVGNRVQVRIMDNGEGIEPDRMNRIFDPFFTTKAPGQGTGLGLSLVQKLVQENEGTLAIRSEVDRGTEVTLEFPANERSEPPASAGSGLAEEGSRPDVGLRILVVDDEASIRALLTRMLGREGHVVLAAEDGGQGLAYLEAQDEGFDLILSDLRMPVLSGPEFLAHLRGRGRGEEARLLFMTGDAASPAAARVLEESGIPYLVKPFTRDELRAAISARARPG